MIDSPYAAVVDPLFKAAGFTVEGSGFGRTITGLYAGRSCRLLISRRTRTRYRGDVRYQEYLGHNVHIDMSIDAHTRCGVFRREAERSWTAAIKRWLGARPVAVMPEALSRLACWGSEPDWASGWLAAPAVQDTLLRLFTPESSPHLSSISFAPTGRLALVIDRVDVRRIAPVRFEQWLADLELLARSADAAPPPLRKLAPTRMELFAERHPVLSATVILFGLFIVFSIAGLVFFGTLVGLVIWVNR